VSKERINGILLYPFVGGSAQEKPMTSAFKGGSVCSSSQTECKRSKCVHDTGKSVSFFVAYVEGFIQAYMFTFSLLRGEHISI